jgi:hypothetical protein
MGAAGQTVTETLYLDVTDPKGIQLAALDEAIGFNVSDLQISDVRAAAGLADIGSYETSSQVDNETGVILIGQAFMGSGLPAVLPYGTKIAVLEFDVTLSAEMSVGSESEVTLLQDGTINGQTKYTAISDDEGALAWTPGMAPNNGGNPAIDGVVSIINTTTAIGVTTEKTAPAAAPVVIPTATVQVKKVKLAVVSEPVSIATITPTTGDMADASNETASPSTTGELAAVGPSRVVVVSVAPEAGVISTVVMGLPAPTGQSLPAGAVSGEAKTGDSSTSLSLVNLAANTVASSNGMMTGSKPSTMILDEAFRQVPTTPNLGSAWGIGASDYEVDDMYDFFDGLFLESTEEIPEHGS